MKEKLKLLILRMEGWKKHPSGYLTKKGILSGICLTSFPPQYPLLNLHLDPAWEMQFSSFKDYLKTKLFWLLFSCILGGLFFLFSDNSTVIKNGIHWFNYAGRICFLFPVGWTLYGIGYMLYHWIKTLLNRKK